MSMPAARGEPGVPGVEGMIALAREAVARTDKQNLSGFDTELERATAQERYQKAMSFLINYHGQEIVNEVVTLAVRQALKPGGPADADPGEEERDLDGWQIPPGTQRLADLLVRFPGRFPGPVLTTNFDPLLGIAVRRAAGQVARTVVDRDSGWGGIREQDGEQHPVDVVHLHGFWRGGDTLHTPFQLKAHRDQVQAELRHLLREQLVAVVGYAGWDDAFTNTLVALATDKYTKLNVVWAFHEKDPLRVLRRYGHLLKRVGPAAAVGRFRPYLDVDCNRLFQAVLGRLPSGTGNAAPAVAAEASPGPSPPQDHAVGPRLQVVNPSDPPPAPPAGNQALVKQAQASLLDGKQLALLRKIVGQLDWLMAGRSPTGRPAGATAPQVTNTMRKPKVEAVLAELRAVRPEDDWPDRTWVLDLDELRDRAETALSATTGSQEKDTPKALLDALSDLRQKIVTTYPETRSPQ
jgi:hypothetical protein